jgi:transposase
MMTHSTPGVIGGFDCHTDTHTAAALDPLGRLLGTETFPVSRSGYRQALRWLTGFGPVLAVGIESTGAYGAGLTRHLHSHQIRVVEINQPHPHTRARRGKSDPIDAEAAARKVLSGEAGGVVKDTSGIVEAIRQLTVARDGAVKARVAALSQLFGLLVTAPAPLREQMAARKTLDGKATLCARLRPGSAHPTDPTAAAKQALRSVARRIKALDDEIAELDGQLKQLVTIAAPATLNQLGVGFRHAATLLVAAGENIDRFHTEAAFAHLCAAAPIPASSGRTDRHRLNYAGNRQANRALHMIVIVRLRYCERTQAYMQRRLTEGRTKKEIIRCLKRYVARDLYRTLRADLATHQNRLDNL